jgi:hypothetical protein
MNQKAPKTVGSRILGTVLKLLLNNPLKIQITQDSSGPESSSPTKPNKEKTQNKKI